MKEVFTEILNMSISASFLIAACIFVRLVFKRMPKYIRCLMWMLVAVRLAIPFTIESSLSLLPAREYVSNSSLLARVNTSEEVSYHLSETGLKADVQNTKIGADCNDYASDKNRTYESCGIQSLMTKKLRGLINLLPVIWIVGVITILIYALSAYVTLRKCVGEAVPVKNCMDGLMSIRKSVYESERIDTAFVLGIVKPGIYVPSGLDKTEMFMVLSHEIAHLKRCDHLVKPLVFIIASVHWFNPLVWVAYSMLCMDIELACDEKVIKKIGYDKKKSYSQTLLNMSVPGRYISACPVAFGEVGTKERVKNIINMEKTKKIIVAVAYLICSVLAIGFLTYPAAKKADAAQDNKNEEKYSGIDHSAPEGTVVVSACSGTVEDAGFNDEMGNYVIVKGNDGDEHIYSHMRDGIKVSKGDKITVEQENGAVGNTGNSTESHLYFGLITVDGEAVYPVIIEQ